MQRFDPSIRDDLAFLGLFVAVSTDRARSVLPETSERVIAEGVRVGFLTEDGSGSFRFTLCSEVSCSASCEAPTLVTLSAASERGRGDAR